MVDAVLTPDARLLKPGTIRLRLRTACRRCGLSFAGLTLAQRTRHIAACEDLHG